MYLKKKQVKGYHYYQLCESYREEGRKRERVMLHLGPALEDPKTLIKWWEFLGRPPIPTRRGRHPGDAAGVINDIERFLAFNYSWHDTQAIIKVLRQLSLHCPGEIAPIHDAATAAAPGQAKSPGPGVYIDVQGGFLFDPETGQISKSEP